MTAEGPGSLFQLLERAARTSSAGFAERPGPGLVVAASTILDQALAAAGSLRRCGVSRNDPVLLALGNSVDFVVAFFGIVAAGAVPVPLPWPGERGRHLARFVHAAKESQATTAIVPAADEAQTVLAAAQLARVVSPADLVDGSPYGPRASSGTTAFVQYTSGSTGLPRPIAPSQENVLAQLRLAASAYDENSQSRSVTWVPAFHDMGLVTGVLRPLYSCYQSVLMEPEVFVRSPQQWLAALTIAGATHTSAPNFGYELCLRKASTQGLDLRSLRVARNAGEPVLATTVAGFTAKFAPVGFRREAMCPSYGLAEAVLTVTTSGPGRAPRLVELRRRGLERQQAEPAAPGDTTVTLVSSGVPLPGTELRILGTDGRQLPPRSVGEIAIAGPQVVCTSQTEPGEEFQRTGDLGFLWSGELVVVGRQAGRFSMRGRTMHAAEIERFVTDSFPQTRPGRVAVVPRGADGEHGFDVLAELVGTVPDERELTRAIRIAVTREFGANPASVTTCTHGSLPLTSSGKLDRAALRAHGATNAGGPKRS